MSIEDSCTSRKYKQTNKQTNLRIQYNMFYVLIINEYGNNSSSSSLGSTVQHRPWPPPQNPVEFLGGFSTIFFLQDRVVSPTPNSHSGGPGLCIYIPQRQGGYPF
jgi:hypothetical protein